MSGHTGGEYKFNFQDLSRFVYDLRYLFRTGGNVFQAGGGIDIPSLLKNILSVIVLIVVIYAVYYVLFKGYPRIVTNVIMFSFYHKENMDSFLKKDRQLFEAISRLSNKAGYDLFDYLYDTSAGSQLLSAINSAKKTVEANYQGLKPDVQLYESLREYYLFQDRYQGTAIEITTPKEKVIVKNKEFYEQLLGYYLNLGKYSAKGKGDDQQMIDIYRLDEKQGFKLYKRASACRASYDALSKTLEAVVPKLKVPYFAYVVLPESREDYAAASSDFEKLGKVAYAPGVYKTPLKQVNPFSWFVIEVVQYKANGGLYDSFASELQSIGTGRASRSSIVKYLNLPPAKRKLAETRVFKGSLPKEFYLFVNKRPIFSHVYFSSEISDKRGFYSRVMNVHLRYYKASKGKFDPKGYLAALASGVGQAKVLVAYMHSLNLFMNVYKSKIVTIYQEQNYANKFFFTRLFNPFFDDFVKNRIATKLKKTFSKSTWSQSYKQFGNLWEKMGKMLQKLVKELPNQF